MELAVADKGFVLRAVCRDTTGTVLGIGSAPNGQLQWMGSTFPTVSPTTPCTPSS